jgi:AcrR family transcriptional regulator
MQARRAPGTEQPVSTPDRLLAATEALILRLGSAGISTRNIGAESGVNWALVSYHFGSLEALLSRLLMLDIERVAAERERMLGAARSLRGRAQRLDAVIAAYMDPMWKVTAAWNPEPAYAVCRELMLRVTDRSRAPAVARINRSVETVAGELQQLLPHLDHDILTMRLRLLTGSAAMMLPQIGAIGLYPLHGQTADSAQQALGRELLCIARAALLARPDNDRQSGRAALKNLP